MKSAFNLAMDIQSGGRKAMPLQYQLPAQLTLGCDLAFYFV